VFTARDLPELPQIRRLPEADRVAMAAVAAVLPFRVNNYVVDELIDWDAVPQDPIFQLTFPQPGMLKPRDFSRMLQLLARGRPEAEIKAAAREIQRSLNPHPGGQVNMNVPKLNGQAMAGVQHKYRETALFFPSAGQTCHSYCTYCFRWAQFVGVDDLRFAGRETETLVHYLRRHPEVTSVLITGGDPLIMRAKVLRRYIEPLLSPAAGLDHLESIRIGTKAPAYWPHRFTADPDADDLLRLFEDVQSAGKHLALMAHYSHPRELSTPASQEAVRRIRSTGAVIRCQAPLIRGPRCGGFRPAWARCPTTCSWSGTPALPSTSRCPWLAPLTSSPMPRNRSRGCAVRCAGRPCRRRRARWWSTALPTSAARRCSR
jgi:L-lysine 2,3-aminomutase